MKKKLVILTADFGLDTSGGSIATSRIFEQIQDNFESINVIAKNIGVHNFTKLNYFRYTSIFEAIKHIKTLNTASNVTFYSDFYMAYYYILANVPFYFTYHDNWPEQKSLGISYFFKSIFYIPVYHWIFKRSAALINVSRYKFKQNAHFNPNTYLVRNGINVSISKTIPKLPESGKPVRIIMLGNVDYRKFGLARALFAQLKSSSLSNLIQVDIFGKIISRKIADQISKFSFCSLQGYHNIVNFEPYHLLLSISKMENLSLAICEALANYTPVIAFNIGGLSEVVKHHKNGILIQKFNVTEMNQAICNFISGQYDFDFNSEELSPFNWEIAGKKYLKILSGETITKSQLLSLN